MAQSSWLAGYEFVATIDGVQYPFKNVSYKITAAAINRSNTKYTPGYSVKRSGIKSLVFTGSGPFREGETALTIGGEYTFILKPATAHVGVTWLGLILDITFDDDAEDGPNMSISVENQEDFDPIMLS